MTARWVLLAALSTTPQPLPVGAAEIVAAIESGDSAAVQRLLADGATVMDERSGTPEASTAAALREFLNGCERTDLTWDVDQEHSGRIAMTMSWSCGPRGATDAYVWATDGRVEFVQFGQINPVDPSGGE